MRIPVKSEKNLVVLAIFCVLAASNLAGFFYLAWFTPLANLVPVKNIEDKSLYDDKTATSEDQPRFAKTLQPLIRGHVNTEEKVLEILKWTVNQARVDDGYNNISSSWEKVEYGRQGGGLLCGDMAQIFHDALIANGIPARRVILVDHLVGYGDTHITVEALIDAKWVMFDPTFNISMRSAGVRLGASEIRSLFISNRSSDLQVEFFGEASYPARIEKYYRNYNLAYTNMFIEISRSRLERFIPIASVWIAPQWAYDSSSTLFSNRYLCAYTVIYNFIMLFLPVLCLATLSIYFLRVRVIGV